MDSYGGKQGKDTYGATQDSWVSAHARCVSLSDSILADINDRNRLQANRVNVMKQNAHIRKCLRDLSDGINGLEEMMKQNRSAMGTDRELSRRQDKMTELKYKRDDLTAKYQKGAPEDTDIYQTEQKKTRAWGASSNQPQAQETEYTRDLSNEQILANQRKAFQDQDNVIDSIGMSVKKQKEIAHAIDDELTLQSKLIDDLERQVDKTTTNIGKETTHVNKVIEKSSTKGLICCLFLCIIIFVVLAATKWGCTIFKNKNEC